jgi:hypothetical protein
MGSTSSCLKKTSSFSSSSYSLSTPRDDFETATSTPLSSQHSEFLTCTLCFSYYKRVYVTGCCSNTICRSCVLEYAGVEELTQTKLEICCPHCMSEPLELDICRSASDSRYRGHTESPAAQPATIGTPVRIGDTFEELRRKMVRLDFSNVAEEDDEEGQPSPQSLFSDEDHDEQKEDEVQKQQGRDPKYASQRAAPDELEPEVRFPSPDAVSRNSVELAAGEDEKGEEEEERRKWGKDDEYEDEEVVVAGSSLPTHAPAGDFIFIEGSGAPKPEAPKTPPRGGGGEWTSSSSNSPFTTPPYSARSLPDLLTPEPGDSGLSTGGGGSNWSIESTA